MPHRTIDNLNAANFLMDQLQREGLNYGCLEVSLQALGSTTELVELLNGNLTDSSYTLDVVQRKGFEPHWLVEISEEFTGADIEDILEGRFDFPDPPPPGQMAGFLGLVDFDDEDKVNHAIAILPRHLLPRDLRRTLKQLHSYVVVDTSSVGAFIAPADWLADYAHGIIAAGGEFAITQLWRVR